MAECTAGQKPWDYAGISLDGSNVYQSCMAYAALFEATVVGSAETPPQCDVQDPYEAWSVFPSRVCEPPEASTMKCTASAPCVMHLTQDQTTQFESWTFVFVVVAMVFAAMHGLSFGSSRV